MLTPELPGSTSSPMLLRLNVVLFSWKDCRERLMDGVEEANGKKKEEDMHGEERRKQQEYICSEGFLAL